jgi:hypothetical protein
VTSFLTPWPFFANPVGVSLSESLCRSLSVGVSPSDLPKHSSCRRHGNNGSRKVTFSNASLLGASEAHVAPSESLNCNVLRSAHESAKSWHQQSPTSHSTGSTPNNSVCTKYIGDLRVVNPEPSLWARQLNRRGSATLRPRVFTKQPDQLPRQQPDEMLS